MAYLKLSQLSDAILLNDKALVEIAGVLERVIHAVSALLKQVDEHRRLLEHTYGD